MRVKNGLRALAFCALTFAVAPGCSSSSSGPPAATLTQIYPLIFPPTTKAQCNQCHSNPANDVGNGKLSMGADQAAAYASLVGKASASSKCGGKPLVTPGDPENSLFYQKMTANPPCGGHMPLGGDPLTAEQLDMVHSWIAAGAKND